MCRSRVYQGRIQSKFQIARRLRTVASILHLLSISKRSRNMDNGSTYNKEVVCNGTRYARHLEITLSQNHDGDSRKGGPVPI